MQRPISRNTLKLAFKERRKELGEINIEEIEPLLRKMCFMSEKKWENVKKCKKDDQMNKLLDYLPGKVDRCWNAFLKALEEVCFGPVSTSLKQTVCLIHYDEELKQIDKEVVDGIVNNVISRLDFGDNVDMKSHENEYDRVRYLFAVLLTKTPKYFDIFTEELGKTDEELAKNMRWMAGIDKFIRASRDLKDPEESGKNPLLRLFPVINPATEERHLKTQYDLSAFTVAQADDAYQRLVQLRQTLISISLNYIVNVEFEGRALSIVSQVYSEPSLKEKLEMKPVYTEDEVLQILLDVAGPLSKLHQHGIVHGKLKPSKIASNDNGEIIFIGICIEPLRTFHSDNNAYCAPEVRQSQTDKRRQPFTVESDRWSFGAMAYQLLTGRKLPEIINTETLFPEDGGINKRMKKLVKKMLRADPRSRPSIDEAIKYLSEPAALIPRLKSKFSNTFSRNTSTGSNRSHRTPETPAVVVT